VSLACDWWIPVSRRRLQACYRLLRHPNPSPPYPSQTPPSQPQPDYYTTTRILPSALQQEAVTPALPEPPAMSALGTLSGGATGVAGLLSLRRRAAPAPAPAPALPQLPAIKLPDGGQLVWGRQLRPSLLLPASPLTSRRQTLLRQPAAAAASESAG
jgi:hypothetical protein